VNIISNNSSLSKHIVHLSLFFTILSFENIFSHIKLITGIMVNIFNIKYILLKRSNRPLSFNQSNHTYTDSLDVPLGTLSKCLRILMSASNSSIGILNNLHKIF
jgi:hypothetical protein